MSRTLQTRKVPLNSVSVPPQVPLSFPSVPPHTFIMDKSIKLEIKDKIKSEWLNLLGFVFCHTGITLGILEA